MTKLEIGDRVQYLGGRESDCGNYFITKCRWMKGTIVDTGWFSTTLEPWYKVQFDGYDEPARPLAASEGVMPLSVLDRLSEIPGI
jgi:hypothetical protein